MNKLKRCTKCILPETMPFIEFDSQGVCNYCRNYKKIKLKGEDTLRSFLDKYRRTDGKPDCVVTFSGGRDSSYGLHYTKKIFNMNPVAYSYDWGMITDLAYRNQARMCDQIGVKHIIISADIRKKRKNIRKNVLAWLKKPDLGTVPLFMAGDKQYFFYANKLSKKLGVKLIILCENPLEKTSFKTGFSKVQPKYITERVYHLSQLNKLKLAFYYAKEFITNPAYLNSSLVDTFSAFVSYYFIPHNFLSLFDYIEWNEQEIERTLINQYNWETDPGTSTTWRIGDGTAAFYNYIYYTVAGFTENDTFRSNQIREGVITREEALGLAQRDNQPRWESLKWYCDTIGIDLRQALKRINNIPKLYN